MKNKTPLALIEMMLLMLVFAFVAAVCLRVFVKSGEISRQSEARDYAVVETQSAAEIIRGCGGDFGFAAQKLGGETDGDTLTVHYAEKNITLYAKREESDNSLLGKARVWAEYENDDELFALEVMWQEGNGDE